MVEHARRKKVAASAVIAILITSFLAEGLQVPQAYGEQVRRPPRNAVSRLPGDEKMEPPIWISISYMDEILLSKDKPIYENQHDGLFSIHLVSVDFENHKACIEIAKEEGCREKYCAREGEHFGRGQGIELKRVSTEYVIIHRRWSSSQEVQGAWVPSQPLHKAAAEGDIEQLKELLHSEPNLRNAQDECRMTPLMWAAYNGKEDTVSALLKHGADRKVGGWPLLLCQTPLHLAVLQGHEEVVATLLKHDTNVNAQDIFGSTPLHSGVLTGSEEIVKLLIAKGANVNQADEDGSTPLHVAVQAYNRNINIVELLLSHGARADARDKEGRTPLHQAADMGRPEMVELLWADNANVNARDKSKSSPLHLAAGKGHFRSVKALLVAGADVCAKNKRGKTALDLATSEGFYGVAEELRRWLGQDQCAHARRGTSKYGLIKERQARIEQLQTTIKKLQWEIRRLKRLCGEVGIGPELTHDLTGKEPNLVDREPDRINKPIFGIYLGESIDALKRRFRVIHEDTDPCGLTETWHLDQGDETVSHCCVETFENKVFYMQVRFADGSKAHFEALEKELEKKFGKAEIPRYFDYQGRYTACVDGVNVEILMQGRYGITVGAFHLGLREKRSAQLLERHLHEVGERNDKKRKGGRL